MTEWPQVSLAEVSEKPQYGAIAKGTMKPDGPRFIRQTDIASGRIDWESVPFCDLDAAEFDKYAVHDGDLLISRLGNGVGNAVTVREARGAVFAGYLVRFRANPLIADSGFLGYQLQSSAWRQHVAGFRSGAAQPTLNAKQMGEFRFRLPPVREQRGIAATLGALDAKIESNRRIIDTEVQLAIVSLSEGDSSIRVGDEAVLTRGLSYHGSGLSASVEQGVVPMLNLANFTTSGQLRNAGLKFYRGEFKQAHRLAELDLVVANTDLTQARELLGRGFLIPPSLEGAIHSHHTYLVRFVQRPWLAVCLWAQLQSPRFRERALGFATGTTVTALPASAVLDFDLRVPSCRANAVERSMPLIRHAWQLETENERLTVIRDTLLPELMSGRIRVPEAHESVEETTG